MHCSRGTLCELCGYCVDRIPSQLCVMNKKDNDEKNFAILVRLWDEALGKPIKKRFLNMPVRNIGTVEKLFDAIDVGLNDKKIPSSNVVHTI